jgi:hypothetical protein
MRLDQGRDQAQIVPQAVDPGSHERTRLT